MKDELFKAMPQNILLEEDVLAVALNEHSNGIRTIISKCNSDDFYSSRNKKLFETIRTLYLEEKGVSIPMIYSLLKDDIDKAGGISYITDVMNSYTTDSNLKAKINELKKCTKRRRIIKLQQNILQDIGVEKSNEEIISNIQNELDQVNHLEEEKDNGSILEGINKTLQKIEEGYLKGGELSGISTGLSDIDKKTMGLHKGEFTIIAGRPGSGKSTLANNIFLNVGQDKKKVLLFNLEMSKEQIYEKMLSNLSYIENNKIKSRAINESEWADIINATNTLSQIDNNARLYDSVINWQDIKLECYDMAKKWGGVDIIIIDYLQLINSGLKTDNKNYEVGYLSRELKLLSKKLNCSVIALSQLSRACEQRADHRPIMSDLRDSGSIEQDADNIHFTYRDEYYNKETEEKGIMEVITGKQRNGETGITKISWIGEYQKVADLELRYN